MNVADLQQLLDDVSRLLRTAGAKAAPLADLAVFREGLTPLRELTLRKLTELLGQVDAVVRGASPPPRAGRPSRGSGQARPDAESLMREVQSLYERVMDPAIREEDVDALMARLTPLTKDGLFSVAGAIELKVAKSRSKDHIIGEIRQRILARKSAHQRTHLLGHPDEAAMEPLPNAARDASPDWIGVPDSIG